MFQNKKTDCLSFVQSLKETESAEYFVRHAVLDFCTLCLYFNYLHVIKVPRMDVGPAHRLARAELKRMQWLLLVDTMRSAGQKQMRVKGEVFERGENML